ncbi:uncharacterized protein FYW49_014791 [Xenentodon cancila]
MFSVALILLLTAGSCVDSLDLIQPESEVVQSGQSLTITCRVSGYSLTDNSYATAWIRQLSTAPPSVFPLIPCGSGTGDKITLGCLAHEFFPKGLTFEWTDSRSNVTFAIFCIDGVIDEDDFSSLWSTAASFIFLFIFSLLYSMIFSLVQVNMQALK